jgi:hypothetical protein
MARKSSTDDNWAAQVAEEAMPGWKSVSETTLEAPSAFTSHDAAADYDSPREADAVMPSLDKLKAKYLGASVPRSDDAVRVVLDNASEAADTALVEMEAGPLRKTIAVSKSKKKVIWSQG